MSAATNPLTWLRATPPFRELPAPLFERVAAAVDVAFHPAGTRLVRAGGTPLEQLFVIRKGAVRIGRDGQTLQILEEGETFGYTSLITGRPSLDVEVEDDLVAYRLPAAEFRRLLENAQFASHFAVELAERLECALSQSPVATFRTDLSLEVQQIGREPAVWVDPDATVGEAARRMRQEKATCVLVRSDPPAIATERDFRNRVLAEGLGPDTKVAAVATPSPRTVRTGTRIYDAWAALLDAGVHHLPILRDEEIVGVLTSTDLLRCSAQGPLAVLRRVERLNARASLPGYAATVTEMASALVAGGLDATVIAGFVARLNDALVDRIVRMAEAELGEAPCRWAWLALGSEGRMEQTLLTDQDNAIVWQDEGSETRAWFMALAERVNTDLEAAGFPRCPGGYMARAWNGTIAEWTRRFEEWVDAPSPEAVLRAAVFFDFRRVAGTLELAVLERILGEAATKPVFVRFLARSALEFKPPPMLVLTLRGKSTVDLKLHGIAPVVLLARCYALEVGGGPRSTVSRLEAAAAAGRLPEDTFAAVAEAYRFLVALRLRLQLERVAKGEPPSSAVPLAELTAVQRSHVKDALRAVKAFQDAGALHFRTDF
jgi:CBS domain-containing protein